MEIPLQAHVECTDGRWGQSVYVLINPVTAKVTDVVVREAGVASAEYIVPLAMVVATLDDIIKLSCSKAELVQLPPFVKTAFIASKVPELTLAVGHYGLGSYFYLPYVTPEVDVLLPVEEMQVPQGALAIWRGTRVVATDGEVGKVDEFVINPATNRITYLVMREGHLWGQHHVIIPLSAVAEIHADSVLLRLDKSQIEALPTFPVRHWW